LLNNYGADIEILTAAGSGLVEQVEKGEIDSAETRAIVSVTPHYTFAAGAAFSREEVKNSFITDESFRSFPLRRDQGGFYWENRFEVGGRLFVNAGVRAELIHTPLIPADPFSGRPEFSADTIVKVNPKVSVAYALPSLTRLHASFGTGIRPPSGFDLAFTDNPRLRPERTASLDACSSSVVASAVIPNRRAQRANARFAA